MRSWATTHVQTYCCLLLFNHSHIFNGLLQHKQRGKHVHDTLVKLTETLEYSKYFKGFLSAPCGEFAIFRDARDVDLFIYASGSYL